MTPSLPKTPAHVEPFVRVLGVEGAIGFLLMFGGAELHLTTSPKGRSRLEAEFGLVIAVQIAEAAAHLPRRMPLAKEWIAAVWTSQGLSDAEIARRLHVTDVTVRAWRKKAPWRGLRKAKAPDPRQLPLPLTPQGLAD
ncbi:response regulator transcription factor [Tabrizicola fusiformis]|uniref:response regulator transcription factor n=1 Tax=Tabrizicola sp. SY72 TaxID=2741673 RepID=UPI001574D0BC|nr:response regulator transcription factor [Tabrizicola sp. SY72]NTT88511.1 response regulator transcription factor [Tabrizicola sp. SY72]